LPPPPAAEAEAGDTAIALAIAHASPALNLENAMTHLRRLTMIAT
jgi:hypothetical protein